MIDLAWEELRKTSPRPGLLKVMRKYFDRTEFWCATLLALTDGLQVMSLQEFYRFWNEFRLIFSPALRSAEEVLGDTEMMFWQSNMLAVIQRVQQHGVVADVNFAANNICHGPFSEQEMTLLLQRHRRILAFLYELKSRWRKESRRTRRRLFPRL